MLRVMGAKKVFRSLNKCICMAGAAREMSKRSEVIKNEKKVSKLTGFCQLLLIG